MNEREAAALSEVSEGMSAALANLDQMLAGREASWTLADLRRDLDRWERELRGSVGSDGQPYSEHTISTHINHSAQFIRWLAGEWRPLGPRSRS
jgi:hypothetical protein